MVAPEISAATSPLAADPTLHPDATTRLNLSWLLRLRWVSIAGQVAMIWFVHAWLGVALDLPPLLALVALGMASNAACAVWLRRAVEVREPVMAALMALDVVLLSCLFYFSGGASNPFSSIYLVNLALAAVVLRPLWTWALVALSLFCFAALFLAPLDPAAHAGHAMAGGGHLLLHLEGMWVAFALGASFIVYFVHRVTRALARREHELGEAREARVRAERLASLATLAAGAAHELSTPLAVIAVTARELERALTKLAADEPTREDARLIREQVERCREILLQMAADAGESTGEDFGAVTIDHLVAVALRDLADAGRVDVALPADDGPELVLPVRAAAQALRALVKNALEASPAGARVRVVGSLAGSRWRIEVVDRGDGMTPDVLQRACEPFFTTKSPGKGMGLGLFLARDVLQRVGGELRLGSRVGHGTAAIVELPAGARAGEGLEASRSAA